MSAPKALCPDCRYPVSECLGHDDMYLIDGGWPPPPLPEGIALLKAAAEPLLPSVTITRESE